MKSILFVAFATFAITEAEKLRKGTLEQRVIDGQDAVRNQFPHQISLQLNDIGHICGGSILNKNWIVTAGHCIVFKETAFYTVVAGILDLTDKTRQKVNVRQIIVHPDYKGGVNPNDIALIQLSGSLTFNDAVQPIDLPVAGVEPIGTATISGWGSISTTNETINPNRLQTADIQIVDYNSCVNALINLSGTSKPLERKSNFCTGPLDQSDGACRGDSGGPLIQDKTLIGIVSWGMFPCGQIGAPSVFTKVSSFLDFINENVN